MRHTIYVENGVGKKIAEAINLFTAPNHDIQAAWQHDVHPRMQRPQMGDEWWIKDVAGKGMVILTQDCAILDGDSERQAAMDSRARIIAPGNAKYPVWDKLRCLAVQWAAVEELINEEGPSAVAFSANQLTDPLPQGS